MPVSPEEFKEAYVAAFVVNRRHLHWNKNARRTAYMTAYIYRTIADSFPNSEIEYEDRKIDAVIYMAENSSDGPVVKPVVAMEHENNVTSIGTELANLQTFNCPLSVVITYTGLRSEYIINRHMNAISRFPDGALLLVLNKEDWHQNTHRRGEPVPWEFLLWNKGKLDSI